jgi:prepilin-type processing-associated H-X9-DG protein
MKPRLSNRKTAALTLVEVLVVVAVLAVLAVLLISKLASTMKKAKRITCVNHLVQINLAFRLWEGDHTNLYPMNLSTNLGGTLEEVARGNVFRHFQVMSNELSTPLILVCPVDVRQPAVDFGSTFGNSNISYFVGLDAEDAKPQTILAGDRNIVVGGKMKNSVLEIEPNDSVGWSSEMHDGVGNIALADGSVQQTVSRGTAWNLREVIGHTGLVTNRLAIP